MDINVFWCFFKTLAITIRCFLTGSPLDSMVLRWFCWALTITIKCFWHAFLPTKMSILGGGPICDIQIHGIWGIQLHLYLKPTKVYITTLVAFCFRKAAPSWVFVDYPGEVGVESKLSGDKKLFLFLPPAPQPVVRIQRWGGNLPPGFVFAQQSCNFSSQDVHRLASFKISEYLHKFVQLFGGVKKKNKFTSSLPLLYM